MDATISDWTDVIRCSNFSTYVGEASLAASSLIHLLLKNATHKTHYKYTKAPLR
jgi:hypothetical protein